MWGIINVPLPFIVEEKYMKSHFAFLLFIIFLISCVEQEDYTLSTSIENDIENNIVSEQEIIEQVNINNVMLIEPLPLGRYYNMVDNFSPDGKMLRVYNDEIMDTRWGPIFSPIIYLYGSNNEVLATYNTITLVSEYFWVGAIRINFNIERHSFDLYFSLDSPGNYGTGYIDLTTYEYIRELTTVPLSAEEISARERQ